MNDSAVFEARPETASLDQWIERQYRIAASAMPRGISATGIVKARPGFGQSVTPVDGSVVASPVPASYDPDPDYFFHWFRDSAIIVDALRLLYIDGIRPAEAMAQFSDFIRFSLSLRDLDGRKFAGDPSWRRAVRDDFQKFLRTDADLARAFGDAVSAETRVNPDGTLDISSWPRPQNDGPASRALAVLRWTRVGADFDAALTIDIAALLRQDLAFTLRCWREPSFDIWEEEKGQHYYTLRVQGAALDEGADWLAGQGDRERADLCRADARLIVEILDGFWLEGEGFYRSRVLESGERSTKELDIAPILAAIHAGGRKGAHSAGDPRMQATLARLEALFDGLYVINKDRPPHAAPALGRYAGDVYYSGGAYYFSTLGAAEFCFNAALASLDRDTTTAETWRKKGDAFLETVRAFTPPNGDFSEQFDCNTGAQTSARHLGWSYAAFISSIAARRAVAARPSWAGRASDQRFFNIAAAPETSAVAGVSSMFSALTIPSSTTIE